MNTIDFVDFYYLEALHHAVKSQMNIFDNKACKLLDDIENAQTVLTDNLYNAIFDYLIHAAFGEASHAREYCEDMQLNDFDNGDYHAAYGNCKDYDAKKALEVLSVLFNNGEWCSAYGGTAWGNIVACAQMKFDDKISKRAMIDHAIDLEHNCGTVFDKHTQRYVDFGFGMDSTLLRAFLDYKFKENILTCEPNQELYRTHSRNWENGGTLEVHTLKISDYLSWKVSYLINRYYTIFLHQDMPAWLDGKRDFSREYTPIEYGDYELDLSDNDDSYKYHCEECNRVLYEEDIVMTDYGDVYCFDCYNEKYPPCEKCGDHDGINEYETTNGDSIQLCESCLGDYYNVCPCCDKIIRCAQFECHYDGYIQYLCEDCYTDLEECSNCDTHGDDLNTFLTWDDNVKQLVAISYCDDCLGEIENLCQCANCRHYCDYTTSIVWEYGNNCIDRFCVECALDLFVECEHCHAIKFNYPYDLTNVVDDTHILCDDCIHSEAVYCCEACGRVHMQSSQKKYVDGRALCPTKYQNNTYKCAMCGHVHMLNYHLYNYHNGEIICNDCYAALHSTCGHCGHTYEIEATKAFDTHGLNVYEHVCPHCFMVHHYYAHLSQLSLF